MIKKSFRLMLLAAFALSSVMFVSCNKWEDDINELDEKVASLEQTVQNLQSAISGGAVVTGVTSGTDGVTFTMSNGQSYTVKHGNNGKDGVNGTNGVDGKTPVITIDPETNNWVIDGVDTGICAKGAKGDKGDKGDTGAAGTNGTNGTNGTDGKDGQNGKDGLNGYSPKISENGFWMVYDDENQVWVETEVVAAFVHSYVIDCGSYYVLNVVEHDDAGEDAGWVSVKLPKTGVITSLKTVMINGSKISPDPVEFTMNYGVTYGSGGVWWKGAYRYANQTLVGTGEKFQVMVNPIDADAMLYDFALVTSKNSTPFTVSLSQHKTDATAPLTRALSANKGVYNVNVRFKDGYKMTDNNKNYYHKSGALYALTTETVNGTVTSGYDVKVNHTKVSTTQTVNVSTLALEDDGERIIDLTDCFGTDFKYVADYYFTMDPTQAEEIGAVIDGDYITATKNGSVKVYCHYLDVNGNIKGDDSNVAAVPFDAVFEYIAPSTTLSDVTWTIGSKSTLSVIDITSLKSMLSATADNSLPSVEIVKVVTYGKTSLSNVNDASLGANNNITLYNASGVKLFKNSSLTAAASSFANHNLYIALAFNSTSTAPGDYTVTLGIRNNGKTIGDYDLTVPVKVTVVSPECSVVKVPGYFNGDNVTVYGTPNATTGKIDFDLASLFDFTNTAMVQQIRFTETKTVNYAGTAYNSSWFVTKDSDNAWRSTSTNTVTNPGKIQINKYDNALYADNTNNVGATKSYTVQYRPYGNKYLPRVGYTFNVTVTSPVAFSYTGAGKTIVTANDPAYIFADEFTGVNLHNGSSIFLANVYDATGKLTGAKFTNLIDASTLSIAAKSDDVNSRFITVVNTFAQYNLNKDENGNPVLSTEAIKVNRSNDAAGIVSDQTCTVIVKFTDKWGIITEMPVSIVVKPIAQ